MSIIFTFPFIEFKTENLGKILKPFTIVSLIHSHIEAEEIMLVDSGADVTLIPKALGRKLKLPPPKKSELKLLSGIAGGVPVVYREVEIKIGTVAFCARIAWAQTEDAPSVLGRCDVFDVFDIEFKQKDKKVLFKKR